MSKHKTIWFRAGWFPYDYAFCPSEKAWNVLTSKMRRPRSWPYPQNPGTTSLMQVLNGGPPVAVVTVLDRSPQEAVELLAHEAMHVWRDIRKQVGEGKPSSELEAYAIQNILHNLMDAYRKTRGPLFIRPQP